MYACVIIFFLWLHLITGPYRTFWSDTVFSLSLIRPHLIFCMQLHLRNMWSQWWSSPMRMNRSNRTMMTTTRSRSSRLATPRHPVSRHSHKYGTWWLNAQHPAQYNHDVFYLCSKWIYLIRHSDPQMEDLTTGEKPQFMSITPVLIISRMRNLHTHREPFSIFLYTFKIMLSLFYAVNWNVCPIKEEKAQQILYIGISHFPGFWNLEIWVRLGSIRLLSTPLNPLLLLSGRDLQIESLKRDLELLRAELERIKAEVRDFKHAVGFRQEKDRL